MDSSSSHIASGAVVDDAVAESTRDNDNWDSNINWENEDLESFFNNVDLEFLNTCEQNPAPPLDSAGALPPSQLSETPAIQQAGFGDPNCPTPATNEANFNYQQHPPQAQSTSDGLGVGEGNYQNAPAQLTVDVQEAELANDQYAQPRVPPPQPQNPPQPSTGAQVPAFLFQPADTQGEGFSGAISTQFASSLSASGHQSPYYHSILNAFEDASVPLRVIDESWRPFPDRVLDALTKELTTLSENSLNYINQKLDREVIQNQREADLPYEPERSTSAGVYNPRPVPEVAQRLAVPEQTPRSQQSGASTPASKISTNKRQRNIKEFDPRKVYKPLPGTPPSWTARPSHRPATTFEYTSYGELTPGRRYTTQEITDYMMYNPGHKDVLPGNIPYHSRLIMWIQSTPADSKTRYPTVDSAKCRFENCPTKGGTIRTGEFRLCFDEQSAIYGDDVDPYHNAGYVHLYCMEANFNFHRLYQDFRVQPDTRRQRKESTNRMAINRDRDTMLDICEEYQRRDKKEMRDKVYNDVDNTWFKFSLTYALTSHHVENMSIHTRKQMDERNGFSLANHMGDLKKLMEFKNAPKESKAELKKQSKANKRVASEMNDDENDEDSEESDGASEYGGRKKRRRRRR